MRELLTSDITLQEIRIQSGCAIEVGGSYIHGNVRDRFKNVEALHLMVKSMKRDNVERGVAYIVNKIENSQRNPVPTKFQERLEVGLEAAVSGFNVIGRITGDNESNLNYIRSETGVTITMRGRGSGFIEPLTGRESSLPLHIHLEHHSNNEKMKRAVSLASDLIRTVKEEWFKISPGVAQSRGDRGDYSLYDREQSSDDGRYRDYSSSSRDMEIRQSSQPRDDWQKHDRYQVYGSEQRLRDDSVERERERFYDRYGRERKEDLKRKVDVWETQRRKSPERVWDGRQKSVNVWDNQAGRQTDWQASNRDSDWGKDLQKMIEEKKKTKKSRWDTSDNGDKAVPNKAVLGVVLDQKKKIEEKLKKANSVNTVEASSLPSTSMLGSVNPLKMNQSELEKLNHQQLLLVSQQQQALLMQITASLTQAISSDYSKPPPPPVVTIPPPITNPLLSSLVPPYPPPAPLITPVTYPQLRVLSDSSQPRDRSPLRDAWRSSSGDKTYSRGFSPTSRRSPNIDCRLRRSKSSERRLRRSSSRERRWRRSPSPDHRLRRSRSSDRQIKRSTSRDRRWKRSSSPDRGLRAQSSDRRWRRSPSPGKSSRVSPIRGRNRSSFDRSPRRDGDERYSPQLADGQERYSPQLDDDYFTPEYRAADRRSRSKSPSRNDPERVAKKLLRFRVAVVDCNYIKLLPSDEANIKKFVDEAQALIPAWKHHKIEYIGFAADDLIYVLMPYTLEGMKWLIDQKYLTKNGERQYILFPFEDIYNKIRMRSIIYFDTLEGYMPTEKEVLLELGRMNPGLNVDQWKVNKFNQEEKGFFLLVSVDFLSYLVLRGLNWKPRYRTSYIKLEPLRSEAKVDSRFI